MAPGTILSDSLRKDTKGFVERHNRERKNSDTSSAAGDSSSVRDRDAELKKKIKALLSKDTNSVIDTNEEELEEIIKQLKSMGISDEKGLELQKLRNIKKGPKIIER